MSVCHRVRPKLADLAVGSLRQRDARRVRLHVESCSDCAAELLALEATGRLLDALTPEPAAPTLWTAIEPRLRPRRDRTWTRRLATAGALAVAVAVAALLLVGRLGGGGEAPVEVAAAVEPDAEHQLIAGLYARATLGRGGDPAAVAVYVGALPAEEEESL